MEGFYGCNNCQGFKKGLYSSKKKGFFKKGIFNLKCSSEYKISFLTQIFGMILNNGSFLIFWWIIFRNVNIIGGYSFDDVLILWGLASSSFGLTYILFGNVRELSDFIDPKSIIK